METMVEQPRWVLTANDRCDAKECGAQAYVRVTGVTGELLFCGHHYNKATSNEKGQANMSAFAFEVVDERERLIENKSKGDDY